MSVLCSLLSENKCADVFVSGMALSMPLMAPLPSIEGQLPDCPVTKWSNDNIDIAAEQVRAAHAHTHTNTHTYLQTHTYTHKHTHTRACGHTRTHTCYIDRIVWNGCVFCYALFVSKVGQEGWAIKNFSQMYKHKIYKYTHMYMYMYVCVCVCICVYVYAYIYTYIYVHTYTYLQTF